jgi:choice-of-anchor C domain-containing protein
MRICRTILPLLLLAGCMGAQMTPSPYGAQPSTVAVRPLSGSPHCPRYHKGTGILADGDFHESADAGSSYFTFAKGQVLAPGWKVTTKTVDMIGTTFWNFDGLCSVDLDGTSAVGGIEHHAFSTKKGAAYSLSFLMSGNDYCGANIKKMKVSVGNQSVVFKWNVANGHSAENGKFAPRYMKFTAVGSTSTLKFTSLDAAGSGCGPVIGAIAVTKK